MFLIQTKINFERYNCTVVMFANQKYNWVSVYFVNVCDFVLTALFLVWVGFVCCISSTPILLLMLLHVQWSPFQCPHFCPFELGCPNWPGRCTTMQHLTGSPWLGGRKSMQVMDLWKTGVLCHSHCASLQIWLQKWQRRKSTECNKKWNTVSFWLLFPCKLWLSGLTVWCASSMVDCIKVTDWNV